MIKNILLAICLLGAFHVSVVTAAEPAMAGAYSKVSSDRKDVKDAADFAVKQLNKGKLVKIVSAKSQIVAGTNYALVLELANASGKHEKYGVVVFAPLPLSKAPMQLTSSHNLDKPAAAKTMEHKSGARCSTCTDSEFTPEVEPDSELFTD